MKTWTAQMRKGLVELAVLAALREGEAYGYQLLQRINRLDSFALTESTVYPLLARLTRDKRVKVRVGPSPHGPPRRYYQLTAKGKAHLRDMTQHWHDLTASVDRLLQGSRDDDHDSR